MHLRPVLGDLDSMATGSCNQEEGCKVPLPGSYVRVKGKSWKGERDCRRSSHPHTLKSFSSAGIRVSSAAVSNSKPSRAGGILTSWWGSTF